LIINAPKTAPTKADFILSMRCPGCRHQGTFETVGQTDLSVHCSLNSRVDQQRKDVVCGQRRCPNPLCRALVFFIKEVSGPVLMTFPAERIDFDSTNIPEPIIRALDEALTCHANGCYFAAAVMVRKSLEELCNDRKAKGSRLVDQIKDLGSKITVPPELIAGADTLRLLGNDAVHVELKDFDQIGQEEVEVSIEFTKELLKAVFQYSSLLERLENLRKSKITSTTPK